MAPATQVLLVEAAVPPLGLQGEPGSGKMRYWRERERENLVYSSTEFRTTHCFVSSTWTEK